MQGALLWLWRTHFHNLKFSVGDLETTAVVTLDMAKGGITNIDLVLDASSITGLSEEAFVKHANDAKQNCLISKVLGSVAISLKVNYGQFQAAI